jgi:hypothetical protein
MDARRSALGRACATTFEHDIPKLKVRWRKKNYLFRICHHYLPLSSRLYLALFLSGPRSCARETVVDSRQRRSD